MNEQLKNQTVGTNKQNNFVLISVHNGKIFKKYKMVNEITELKKKKINFRRYFNTLENIGIPLAETKIKIIERKTKKSGVVGRFCFVQKRGVPLEGVFRRKSKDEVLKLYSQLLIFSLKIWRKDRFRTVFLDSKLENWIFIDKQIRFVDFWPPFIRGSEGLDIACNALLYRFVQETRYSPLGSVLPLLHSAIKTRPELKKNFFNITTEMMCSNGLNKNLVFEYYRYCFFRIVLYLTKRLRVAKKACFNSSLLS